MVRGFWERLPGDRYRHEHDGQIKEAHKLPDGKPMQPFEHYKVRTLKKILRCECGCDALPEGSIVDLVMTPNCFLSLMDPEGLIIESDAREGVNFEFPENPPLKP